jgi:hypothetical protein
MSREEYDRMADLMIPSRLHEKDMDGAVLEDGGYVHLDIPMCYDPEPDPTGRPPIDWSAITRDFA